ncbi:MAG: c-type cytochrome [Polyangiaceae bacterium]
MLTLRHSVGVLVLAGALAATSSCKKPELLRGSDDKFTVGNLDRGAELVERFECGRCHAGPELHTKSEKACVTCHEDIVAGSFKASPEAIAKWQPIVRDLRFAPSLEGAARYRSAFLVSFLQNPHDLRPNLTMSMPRLAISEADARDITTYLRHMSQAPPATSHAIGAPDLEKGDAQNGRVLLGQKGCTHCHVMTGGPAIPAPTAPPTLPAVTERAMALAPDLRYARDRFEPAMLAAWIEKPSAMKVGSDMPDLPMTRTEARDIATFLLTAPLAPRAAKGFARLPVLERPVKFDEVNAKVFHRTCWHCHSEPDFAIGDGGPGNSGGFGFPARGVDLSSFQGVMAGFFDRAPGAAADAGPPRRKSLFAPAADGTPRLLASLLARHREEDGAVTGEVRGMPLGLPALSAADIQLVETWIAQGRPR